MESIMELGPKQFSLQANAIYIVEVSDNALLVLTDVQTGEVLSSSTISPLKKHRIKSYKTTNAELQISEFAYWSHKCIEHSLREVGDPIPIEISEDEKVPLTLEEKLMRAFGNKLLAQYGEGSQEVETMEDALDFDIDGDGEISSPYEVKELDSVELAAQPPQKELDSVELAAQPPQVEQSEEGVPASESTPAPAPE